MSRQVFDLLTACVRGRVGVLVTGEHPDANAALAVLLGDAVPDTEWHRFAGDLGQAGGPGVLRVLYGPPGWLGTLTASGPRDAVRRLEIQAHLGDPRLGPDACRETVAAALDVVVHLTRLPDGTPRIARVTEVVGLVADVVAMQELFALDHRTGRPEPRGLRPLFLDRLHDQGIDVGPRTFALRRGVG